MTVIKPVPVISAAMAFAQAMPDNVVMCALLVMMDLVHQQPAHTAIQPQLLQTPAPKVFLATLLAN